MLRVIVGVFVVLHSLVHLLYFGQSRRLFELRTNLVWPDGSWAFSKLLGDEATRSLASVCCVLAAIVFAMGSLGIFIGQAWWQPVIVGAAAFSAITFILFWDGKLHMLAGNGGIGLLIDTAMLASLLILQWPVFEF